MKKIELKNIKNLAAEVNAAIENDTEIVIEKGVYHIWPRDLTLRNFYITNSLPLYQCDQFGVNYDKHIAVLVENKKNVTVDGGGAKLICHGKMIPFYAFQSENVTLKNITIDYADPTVTEMTVLEVGEGYYICSVHPDSHYRIDENGVITWYGENFEVQPTGHNFQRFLPDRQITRRRYPSPMSDKTSRYEDLGNRRVKLTTDLPGNPYMLEVGMMLQQRDGIRDECGLLYDKCKNALLDNVNMQFMHGLGLVFQCTDGVTVKNCSCAPDPDSGRKCSSFADCCQISNCRGQVSVTDCLFFGAHDDAINVHGTYLKIVESKDNTIIARYIQPDTIGFNFFNEGDTVEVCDPEFMLKEDRATVVSSELINTFDIRITFDKPVEKFKEGFVIENISASPDVYIAGCTVKLIPTRGFLVSTRGHVLVENNEFYGLCRAAVFVANDAAVWYETGPVEDITIRNNRIYDQSEQPIFRFQPENKQYREGEYVHKNILIENNIAEGAVPVAWLWAKSTDNIVMRGNTANFEPLQNELTQCGKVIIE
ncbi:MAG: right-handed parallel beta-helix repeat-containing protein [Clostridia bacterium]|nr:right-handed parallel beta-helix repeat-containing protein [Clostridia bacterium]